MARRRSYWFAAAVSIAVFVACAGSGCDDDGDAGWPVDASVPDGPVGDATADAPVADAPVADAAIPDARPDAMPPPSCSDYYIAYVADQNVANQRELFVVGVQDGPVTTAERVNHDLSYDEQLYVNLGPLYAWSPNGNYLAYRVRNQSAANALYLVDMSSPPSGTGVMASSYIENSGGVRDFAWSPDSTKIAYVADRSGNGEFQLFVADVNNPGVEYLAMTSLMRIDLPGLEDRAFFWSPDSKKLLFRATVYPSTEVNLYFTDVTQPAQPVKVNDGSGSVKPSIAWSPDGSMVSYVRGLLYVAQVSGNVVTARHAVGGGTKPMWSPDGRKIAFYAGGVSVADVSAWPPGAPTSLTAGYPYTAHEEMKWSPDSSRIAFRALYDASDVSLSVVDVEGPGQGMPVVVSTPAAGEAMPGYQWSANAQMLAYRQNGGTTGVMELYMVTMAAPSTQLKVNGALPAYGSVGARFAWSPDSSAISYQADAETDNSEELYLTRVVAGVPQAPIKLNTQLPTDGHVESHVWSPDGTRIAYLADQTLAFTMEALLVNVSGATPTAPQRVNGILITGGDVWETQWRPCH